MPGESAAPAPRVYSTWVDRIPGPKPHWDMIRTLLASVADVAIVPLQDLLGLGSEARMNLPARPSGNWGWRFAAGDLTGAHARRLRELAVLYGRAPRAEG